MSGTKLENKTRSNSTLSSMSDEGQLLRFAIPKKGRLHDRCVQLLEGAGLQYVRAQRLDIAYCTNFPVLLVFLPAADIAVFVGEGDVDLGITGQDMVAEAGVEVDEVIRTGIGKCKLALQAPVKDNIVDAQALAGKRICTSFPNLTRKFFDKHDEVCNTKTDVKYVSGSVEAACKLGLADAVVDLVETGTTMRAAGLEIICEIMKTEAVVIRNPQTKFLDDTKIIEKRIKGFLLAQKFKMMYYNVARSNLDKAVAVTPGHRGPTITSLNNEDWVSVGAMVNKDEVSDIMDKLEDLGATDIFVVDLYNCRA